MPPAAAASASRSHSTVPLHSPCGNSALLIPAQWPVPVQGRYGPAAYPSGREVQPRLPTQKDKRRLRSVNVRTTWHLSPPRGQPAARITPSSFTKKLLG